MATMEGPLSKWTNVVKGWQYRWFVLDEITGLLSYYTSKEKMMKGARRGCVRLKNSVIGIDDGDDSTFTITVDSKTFHFQARDGEEREKWIRALEETKNNHASIKHRRWDGLKAVYSVQDFDKKLFEADTYLQLLIDQIKNLEGRMDKCVIDEDKERYFKIHEQANSMLDYVKHAIVLLQIAKNATKPAGADEKPKIDEDTSLLSDKTNEIPLPSEVHRQVVSSAIRVSSMHSQSEPSIVDSESIPENNCDDLNNLTIDGDGSEGTGSPSVLVPETSYSSSEDDDFYDACDDAIESSNRSPSNGAQNEHSINDGPKGERIKKWYDGDVIDYDAMYDLNDEEDLGSVEDHGSVISHLLSQVRLGMDLTKVVLPTFILECRSLLEMYADFFAHPDLFTSIVDYTDPKDRMVQVVKWYLSAFHAGRKSSVAKKPYNPIIGEIFRCHWNIPGDKQSEQVPDVASDGPIPWARKDQLTFVAEQVSHHPPISAFYGEHFKKRISFCAHIWTKSKFLGLSIGVHNIGQGCISLLNYDEEYIVTFPNGYGRSILTVPWIELGGSTSITCAKSGYYANMEFITKPFYGGKKHRVTADVFQPNDKKPFLNVSGEWNGAMQAKWSNGTMETFVDTKALPTIEKIVQPVSSQLDNESRKLWKDVTANLKLKDVDKATEYKFKLEQRQREEAKQRKEKNQRWETKLFHEIGANWIYDMPLQKRFQATSSSSAQQ